MQKPVEKHLKNALCSALPGILLALVFALDLTLMQLHKAKHQYSVAPQEAPTVRLVPGDADAALGHHAASCPICQHLSMMLVTPHPACLIRDLSGAVRARRVPSPANHPGRVDLSLTRSRAPPAVVSC